MLGFLRSWHFFMITILRYLYWLRKARPFKKITNILKSRDRKSWYWSRPIIKKSDHYLEKSESLSLIRWLFLKIKFTFSITLFKVLSSKIKIRHPLKDQEDQSFLSLFKFSWYWFDFLRLWSLFKDYGTFFIFSTALP